VSVAELLFGMRGAATIFSKTWQVTTTRYGQSTIYRGVRTFHTH
jgi:hypothetical protein